MKAIIKRYIPPIILNYLRELYIRYLIYTQPRRHRKALKRLQRKDKIKVAFFATHSSVWKYDYLYRLMVKHSRFEPIIIACPVVNYGMENMLQEMDKCYNMFHSRKYNVIRSYNVDTQEYLDVKTEINPDIIFYTNPYKGVIDDRYYISKFLDKLTCYAPYGYAMSNNENVLFNLPFHNLLWKVFYETDIHKELAQQYAINAGVNVVTSGYLLFDEFNFHKQQCKYIKSSNKKIIIWAPHHTIEDNSNTYGYSCFLEYSEIFINLRDEYKDIIYWIFKPHPILREKLYKHPLWGKTKTEQYYNNWNDSDYSEINEGDYTDIFLKSDAMILDSISFVAEYFYTKKPLLFTTKDETILNKFNRFGKEVFKHIYKSRKVEEIKEFIDNVVLRSQDPLYENRNQFYENVLFKKNVSKNILNILEIEIGLNNN